jgi:hypothetical protein
MARNFLPRWLDFPQAEAIQWNIEEAVSMSYKEPSMTEADDLGEKTATLHPTIPDDEEEAINLLGQLLGEGAVEEARALVREAAQRWPDSPKVQKWARVLEPPKVRVLEPRRAIPRDKESAWIRQHAHEYPGRWLALRGDQLIAADADVAKVLEIINSTGHGEEFLLHFQPDTLWPQ